MGRMEIAAGRFLRMSIGVICLVAEVVVAAEPDILARPPSHMTPQQRHELVEAFRRKNESDQRNLRAIGQAQGWKLRGILGGRPFELEAVRNGKVYADAADNRNAGISVAADKIQAAPFGLTGTNIIIGLWESAGVAMSNHQEYVGRVLQIDSDASSSHGTHVAGTLAASGVSNAAAGMAPGVILKTFNNSFDETEMALAGRAAPAETNVIELSNHSYSSYSGWESDFTPWRWYGLWPATESDNFGIYEDQTRDWDVIAYAAPFYLIFKSAGNNRDDAAPSNGQAFAYFSTTWKTSYYDSSTHPLADGWDNGGFDTITPKSNAKNIVTVGAVSDAVSGDSRSIASATMTTLSGWGPTDDGRVKPDLVANGQSLYSCDNGSTNDYATKSGTSMSSPNACGAAALLLELYRRLFGTYPLSSTIKGLLLHTADDLGNRGPDFVYGWGLVNVHAAADHLVAAYVNPDSLRVVEDALTATTNAAFTFVWRSNGPIRATLCWTDPPGPARTGLDNTNLALINDLDLRLCAPDGTVYYPWILDPTSPTNPATTGNNFRDNVEQVCITNPAVVGVWTAVVSVVAAITNGVQEFSLLLTGHDDDASPYVAFSTIAFDSPGLVLSWSSLTGQVYQLSRATHLLGPAPFTTVIAPITGAYLTTSYTDTTVAADSPLFYRIERRDD